MVRQDIMGVLDPSKIVYKEYCFYTYAVIEGGKHPMLWSDLEEGILEYDILFEEEELRDALQKRGPFLVQLDFESQAGKTESEALLKQCYGNNSMTLFATPLQTEEALARIREIFYLEDETGEREGIMRFYEPLHFHELVKQNTQETIEDLFKYIYCYWCEDVIESSSMIVYRYTYEGVEKVCLNNIALKEPVNVS